MCMSQNMGREERIIFLLCTLLFLNVLDLLLTVYGIHRGYMSEANPLMAWVLASWGYGGFALAKALLVGNGILCGWIGRELRWMEPALVGLNVLYILVCAWNAGLNLYGVLR